MSKSRKILYWKNGYFINKIVYRIDSNTGDKFQENQIQWIQKDNQWQFQAVSKEAQNKIIGILLYKIPFSLC